MWFHTGKFEFLMFSLWLWLYKWHLLLKPCEYNYLRINLKYGLFLILGLELIMLSCKCNQLLVILNEL